MPIATLEPMTSTEQDSTPQPVLIPLSSLLELWDNTAQELHEARQSGKQRGAITNLTKLDHELGGALLPGVHVVHGIPGVGKSAFALQIAATCGCPCLFVTCEMPPLELLRRITARTSNTFLGKFKTGELPPPYAGDLARKAIAQTPYLALLDATHAHADAAALLTAAEHTRRHLAAPDNAHFLLVLDSLHSWANASESTAAEYDRLGEHLAALKRLSSRLLCPILAIAERNRASMDKGGLSAGAGHRGIEYGAESVLDLDCPQQVQPDAAGEVPVTLKIQKNRNGSRGRKIDLVFHGALQRYREA